MKRSECYITVDGVPHKWCPTCKQYKSYSSFNRDSKAKRGMQGQCRDCQKMRARTPKGKYQWYKKMAKKRGKDFNLTFEQFCIWWQKPCFYCGDEITTIGLDRIDSSRGYEMDNVVPCCSQCNFAKLDYSQEDFVAMCVKVAARHGGA